MKARAIVKRRKAVRNIRKITKTMQMIATAKFQKALKRAKGTKPYAQKVHELVDELAAAVGDIQHPLLRVVTEAERTKRIALLVLTSNRGLAGAYNGHVLRTSNAFIHQQEAAGNAVELHLSGKKGITYFNFRKQKIEQRYDKFADMPRYVDVDAVAQQFMDRFVAGKLDAVYVAYMKFHSAGVQKPEVLTLLPLGGVGGDADKAGKTARQEMIYDFFPSAKELLDELLPQTVKTTLFQCFLDATTSENVSRMVSMKSATDNADKMIKSLSMKYNRARQSQITTELSEIMGGVEAMKN